MELNGVLFPACWVVKMAWISTSVLFYAYSKLYILTEISANDVKFVSVDRQKLELSKYIYLRYRKFYICRDTARFYEHKNDPRIIRKCHSHTLQTNPRHREEEPNNRHQEAS